MLPSTVEVPAAPALPAVRPGPLGPIYELFDRASNSRLRITLHTPSGLVVVIKRATSRSNYPGQLHVTDEERYRYPHNKYFGRIDLKGNFRPVDFHREPAATPEEVSEVSAILERLAASPRETMAEQGHMTGRCGFCNSPLSDPHSLVRGYGPDCAKNFGLPWKADKEPA